MKRRISRSVSIPQFQESIDAMSVDSKIFVDKSLEIAHYIQSVLEHQGIKQKDLADRMQKSEAEVSKWLSGLHNFTLRSLAKVEAALGSVIISVPDKIDISIPATSENLQKKSVRVERREPSAASFNINYASPSIFEGNAKGELSNSNMLVGAA